MVPVCEPGHVAVDVVLRARDVEDPVVVATVTFLLDELRRLGVVSVQLGPMLFQTEDVTGEVGMSRDAEFPFLGTVLRWVLTGVPMLEKYRTLQQTKRLFVPQRMEPRYLLFHPARPTPELLLAFVGALFPELSLRGLVNELVSGLTSRRKSGLESHGKEEEE
jgi:hypothetical protein